ncbi:MAG: ribose 5-phosphate isomerase B [Bacteroidia bacterium]|nr:ribose 5-phosphate isomerase B [Bacteroidia bacterium]
MSRHKIIIGNDHAGTSYKMKIKDHLEKNGFEVINVGTDSEDSTDYPDYIHPLAESIEAGKAEFGVAICGSANGVAMTANKHQGVRAAIAWTDELSSLAREHNDANVICIPARFITIEEAISIVDIFVKTKFEGGRHERRVNKIACA